MTLLYHINKKLTQKKDSKFLVGKILSIRTLRPDSRVVQYG